MDVEDIIADLMLNLFNKADITAGIENLTAYIYRSLHNRLIDRLRKSQKTVSLDQPLGFDKNQHSTNMATFADMLADSGRDLTDQTTAHEVKERLYQALDSLDVKQRAVWVATEIEGYSFRELAELWDQPIGTLLARKHRATEALRVKLADFYQESAY